MKRLRVLLADDHGVVRKGLRFLLESEPGMEVAGEAADGRQAVELAEALDPDVVVMDIAMPRLNDHSYRAAKRRGLKRAPLEYLRDNMLVTTSARTSGAPWPAQSERRSALPAFAASRRRSAVSACCSG